MSDCAPATAPASRRRIPHRFAMTVAGVAGVATAANAAQTQNFQITGTLSGKCKVEFLCPGSRPCSEIKFSAKLGSPKDTPNDSTGEIKWSCNLAGQSVTLTFHSANGGILRAPSGRSTVPYKMAFAGTNANSFSNVTLDSDKSTTGIAAAALTAYYGTLTLTTIPGPNLQAGEYVDTISVTITPSGL